MRYFFISFISFFFLAQSHGAKTVIVLDPGHGGKDPGSVSPKGTKEKQVTLIFAQKLQSILKKNENFTVYLTRARDKWFSTEDRIDFAKNVDANIFIAIHVDVNEDTHLKGMCLYTFGNENSEGLPAEFVLKENSGEEMELTPEIAHIVADITQTDDQGASMRLAESILAILPPDNAGNFKKVRSGKFKILRQMGVVRILIELGLFSNSEDEKRLTDPNELQDLAKIVAEGIEDFTKDHSF